jgi:hypothetical protein
MFIHRLQATIYPRDGSPWFTEAVKHPSWLDIEAAIRRLDRDHFPFICLFCDEQAADTAVPDFTVLGGLSAYTFGPEHSLFFDETHSNEEIHVWLSDQGASFPDKQVCHDLETVLRATKLFAEIGQLDKSLTWKTLAHR